MKHKLWTCVLTLLLSLSALAQTRLGISGAVSDPSGAIIPIKKLLQS